MKYFAKALATFAVCGLGFAMLYYKIDACGMGFLVVIALLGIWSDDGTIVRMTTGQKKEELD